MVTRMHRVPEAKSSHKWEKNTDKKEDLPSTRESTEKRKMTKKTGIDRHTTGRFTDCDR